MTERREWLKIGRKCLRASGHVFLCNEVRDCILGFAMRQRMHERLELFEPPELTGAVWWGGFGDDDECYNTNADYNRQRALACCFLAAMAEEEKGE